jgi:hypothetical protein
MLHYLNALLNVSPCRRNAELMAAEAAATRAPEKVASTPPEVIAALPVMAYSDIPTVSSSSSSSSSNSGGQCGSGVKCEQHSDRKFSRSNSDSRVWRCSSELQQQQQQQQQVDDSTGPAPKAARFIVRLSLDSALAVTKRKGHSRTNSTAAAAALTEAAVTDSTPPAAAGPHVESEGDTCAICFCEYEGSDLVKRLPCGHFYHTGCIDAWLAKGTTCPLCKRPVWEGGEEDQQQQQQQEGDVEQGTQQQQQQQGADVVVVIAEGVAVEGPVTADIPVPAAAAAAADCSHMVVIMPAGNARA